MADTTDEGLDAELARIQAAADAKIAAAKGRATPAATPTAAPVKPKPAAPDDEESHQTWDDFWAEVERAEADERGTAATEVIRGVEVVVPHDLPLRFQKRLEDIQGTEKRVKARVAAVDARIAAMEAAQADGADVDVELTALRAAAENVGQEEARNAAESTGALLADLFGTDVLDAWVDGGMTETELQVVLLWGMAHGKGQPMTHREAYDAYRAAAGKAPSGGNAPAKSSSTTVKKKPRAATGGRSKATSGGSTGSGRGTSRSSRTASS